MQNFCEINSKKTIFKIGNLPTKVYRPTYEPFRFWTIKSKNNNMSASKKQESAVPAPNVAAKAVPKNVPIQRTDLSTFDDSYSFLKEKFVEEMRRMDEEMNRFSADLRSLYEQAAAMPAAVALGSPILESLFNSPLVQGEGDDKMLKLQFDLSQFDPNEIKVQIMDDVLVVAATHQEKTESHEIVREFKREFVLPHKTNPDAVISSLSRDGVLTVQAPIPKFGPDEEAPNTTNTVLTKKAVDPKKVKKTESKEPQIPKSVEETKLVASPAAQVPATPLSPVSPAAPQNLPAPPAREPKVGSKTSKTK